MLNLNHKKLDVWKMSVSFVTMIYELRKEFPKSEIYGITGGNWGQVLLQYSKKKGKNSG